MDFEPEIKAVVRRLKQFGNTVCTDDLINGMGSQASKTYDMSKFDPKMKHSEKIRILGRDALIRRLREDGILVWIRFSDDGSAIIELNEILQNSKEYGERMSRYE